MESFRSSVFEAKELASALKRGSLALFPTDTLPALAVSAEHAKKLREIKNRPLKKPLILMGPNSEDLMNLISSSALDDVKEIAKKFWPGPLTMVVPSSDPTVEFLNPGFKTIGIRVPGCPIARDLLEESGPLATTSANLSGQPPSLNAAEAAACFPGVPLLGPIPWPNGSGLASTVIAWEGTERWKLLRKGTVVPWDCLIEK